MQIKRPRAEGRDQDAPSERPAKRRRSIEPRPTPSPTASDLLSPLSDELLVRILSFLPLGNLLAVAPVSHRFARLAADSQLWKLLYYARFVLPRAMRIPGFRDGHAPGASAAAGRHRLHYSGRQALWADGKSGGVVGHSLGLPRWTDGERETGVDWKRQYKIRHNWVRGRCAVEELKIGTGAEALDGQEEARMLVKIVEGIAVTADRTSGLRAWDLKARHLLAQVRLGEPGEHAWPTCMAIDDQAFGDDILDIAVGFSDGSFAIWQLGFVAKTLVQRCRHQRSSNGMLIGIAYSYPYLHTATDSVLVSLYNFQGPTAGDPRRRQTAEHDSEGQRPGSPLSSEDAADDGGQKKDEDEACRLPLPYLLTSLRSHTSRPPLALSIRKLTSGTIASIAYTFSTRQGWSIGIQDLHIKPPSRRKAVPEVITTRLAYTAQVNGERAAHRRPNPRSSPASLMGPPSSPLLRSDPPGPEGGPIALSYTHPYLLATLPDNTLVLHLCTSSVSALSISPGIRLWGHTSGISDAEITARGRAVSISSRGGEMRVWELEGRPAVLRGRSVEIRPGGNGYSEGGHSEEGPDWDERRSWVGFDDEMVIVLKESRGGRESLMVYDFT